MSRCSLEWGFRALRGLAAWAALAMAAGAWAQPAPRCTQSPPRSDVEPMRYCFAVERGIPVIWLHGEIKSGSAEFVRQGLDQTSRYREVWLNSGGGNVEAGKKIGYALQALGATVRVPSRAGVICASSCTNLMLGGYNRIVEEGARFLVHAMSSVSDMAERDDEGKLTTWGNNLEILKTDPNVWAEFKAAFRKDAEKKNESLVHGAIEVAHYYQKVIGGTPRRAAYERLLAQAVPAVYAASGRNLDADVTRVRQEGMVAVQEIFTQIELRAMRQTLATLRTHEAELGRGAKVALRIFDATLACRIQDVCLLDRHQLASLGYHNFDVE